MKARLLVSAITTGHVATDYLHLVHANQNPSTADTRPQAKAAKEVLESFEDQDRSLPVDPAVPIKRLVRGLTESLQGTPVANDNGRIDSAKLYRGCKVRLVGIPERQFAICDIFWDYQEVRVIEVGTKVEYVLPWDCLRFPDE